MKKSFPKIIFIKASRSPGSGTMRGNHIAKFLSSIGYDTAVTTIKRAKRKKFSKDQIVVCVKWFDRSLMDRLRNYDCKIIFDVVDGYLKVHMRKKFLNNPPWNGSVDGVIASNDKMLADILPKLNGPQATRIYHHWDPDIQLINKAGNIKAAYIGTPKNIYPVKRFDNVKYICEYNKWFSEGSLYDVHLSIRKPNTRNFFYKPNTKLSFAARCKANMISSGESSHRELLPPDYPFFVNDDYDEIQNMINYAISDKSIEDRKYGLACMADVEKMTSPSSIAKDYIDFFEKIINNDT
jgi:hypothetical protein